MSVSSPNYNDALRIAILIKLYVKMRVSEFECSEMLQRYGIRFSIGVADIKYADKVHRNECQGTVS